MRIATARKYSGSSLTRPSTITATVAKKNPPRTLRISLSPTLPSGVSPTLHAGAAGIDDIIEMFDCLGASYGSGAPPGCYIANDMSIVPTFPARARYLETLETGIRAALDRSANTGEINPGSVARRTKTLTAALIGVNTIHKETPDNAAAVLDAMKSEAESWRA